MKTSVKLQPSINKNGRPICMVVITWATDEYSLLVLLLIGNALNDIAQRHGTFASMGLEVGWKAWLPLRPRKVIFTFADATGGVDDESIMQELHEYAACWD